MDSSLHLEATRILYNQHRSSISRRQLKGWIDDVHNPGRQEKAFTSEKGLRKQAGITGDKFQVFRLCGKCFARKHGNEPCTYRAWPDHHIHRLRQECGSKDIRLYPYRKLSTYITELWMRIPNLKDLCNHWLTRDTGGFLCDIVDAPHFLKHKEWLSDTSYDLNLLFMMSLDWYQQYERGPPYSVGVIYLTVLNLPRSIRMLKSNILIPAIIPGPSEPKGEELNVVLAPLVEELKTLDAGVMLNGNVKCRARLSLVCADLPAARKVLGISSVSANLGCSKCSINFENKQSADFNNFAVHSPRNHHVMIEGVKEMKAAKTKSEYDSIKKLYGVRYTQLLELDYFKPFNDHCFDVMHNMYIGTPSYIMSMLVHEPMYDATTVAQRCLALGASHTLCEKIFRNYSTMTAADWKEFTLRYSLYALEGSVAKEKYHIWSDFVEACHLLTKRSLSNDDIARGSACMNNFLQAFQRAWSPSKVRPNMHIHMHVGKEREVYGPAAASWCFAFERMNFVCSEIKTNGKDIEVQIMRSFDVQHRCNVILKNNDDEDEDKSGTWGSVKEPERSSIKPQTRYQYQHQNPAMLQVTVQQRQILRHNMTLMELQLLRSVVDEISNVKYQIVELIQCIRVYSEKVKPGTCIKARWGEDGYTKVVGIVERVILLDKKYVMLQVSWLNTLVASECHGLLSIFNFKQTDTTHLSFLPPTRLLCVCTHCEAMMHSTRVYVTVEDQSKYCY